MPGTAKKLVSSLTVDDRNFAGGYALQELAKLTSDITQLQKIEELTLKKLESKKPYVKYKSLRIIKYLCENGDARWRRSWQRHTDKLRQCQQFTGTADPVYGDTPYQNVRQAAKEAMEAIFSNVRQDTSQVKMRMTHASNAPTNHNTTSKPAQNNPQVLANPSISSQRSTTSTKGPEGFGNTKYHPKTHTQPFQPLANKNFNPVNFGVQNPHSSTQLDNRVTRKTDKREKRKPGGTWTSDNDDENNDQDNNDQDNNNNDQDNEQEHSRQKSTDNIQRTQSKSDGRFERQWVDQITKGSGVQGKIAEDDLKTYVAQFENLSQEHVLQFIEDKLEDSDNVKEQAKALTLLNGLLQGKSKTVVEQYLLESPNILLDLLNTNKSVLKKTVQEIIDFIGLKTSDNNNKNNTIDTKPKNPNNNNNNNNNVNNSNINNTNKDDKKNVEEDFLHFSNEGNSQSNNLLDILNINERGPCTIFSTSNLLFSFLQPNQPLHLI